MIRRANPALQQTDKVLAQLADQNQELAQLAADSDQILDPLARERDHLAGFIKSATIAGRASAERRDDISEGFARFPDALNQLQLTMVQLRRFAEEGTPVATNLRTAAPGLTGATRALRPFSRAGTGAVLSLGRAADASGPDLAASDSVINDLRTLADATTPGAKSLRSLLSTFRRTKGIDYLMSFLLNTSNVFNGFDSFGHFLRAEVQITNCVEYLPAPSPGCDANWSDPNLLSALAPASTVSPSEADLPGVEDGDWNADGKVDETDAAIAGEASDAVATDDSTKGSTNEDGTDDLFEFLLGDGR